MSQQTAVATQAPAQPIDTVRAQLEKMKDQFAMVLPRHLTPERMFRVAMTAIQQTPKLLECDRKSLYSAVMRAAQLGLEPDGILGQAYLIPYGKQVQFIPGYKGLIDLARRSGEVSNIIAKEVCKNDEFTVDFSLEVPFVHKPKLDGDRGEITHFWAMARFKDGGFHWDYMTKAEVQSIRDQSSGWQSAKKYSKTAESPWEKHFVEMGKKTAIRRIAKYLPMSVQKAAMVEDLVNAGKSFTTNEFGEFVIDGDTGEVIDGNAEPLQNTPSKLDQFVGTSEDPAAAVVSENKTAATSTMTEASPFDLANYRLETQTGTKSAIKDMVGILGKFPQEERAAQFVALRGPELVDLLGKHGLGMEKKKFTDLGIAV